MLLQLGSGVEAKLRETNQYGAGTKNGADLVYHKLNESMDPYVAAAVHQECCHHSTFSMAPTPPRAASSTALENSNPSAG
jgi:hypothetical protein